MSRTARASGNLRLGRRATLALLLCLAAPDLRGQQPDSLLGGPGVGPAGRAELAQRLAEGPLVLRGATEIPRDSVLPAPLLVIGGDLRFQGRTAGSVTVVGGDFYLRPGAEIGGDAVVVEGGFYGTGLARVDGERRVVRGDEVTVLAAPGAERTAPPPEPEGGRLSLRGVYGFRPEMYNRVDGLAVRWGGEYRPPPEASAAPRLAVEAIVRTSRDDLGWEASAEKELRARRLTLRAAWYNFTDTAERWHRGDAETSLAAFFLGEDNRFYFDRQGVELRALQEVRGPLAFDLALRNDEYRSVAAGDPLTVASDDFQPNPPVTPGTMRSFLGGATWDDRDDPEEPARGWWARMEGEAAGGLLEGAHSFTSARVDLRRYQPVGAHRLDVRVVAVGRVGGTLPEQKRHHLGGAATLAGYEALQVRGDRAALVNLRYRIPFPPLRRLRPFREGAWLALLADAGDAWESADDDVEWLASAGAGITARGLGTELGLYAVVPTREVSRDQAEVSVFLFLGRFF